MWPKVLSPARSSLLAPNKLLRYSGRYSLMSGEMKYQIPIIPLKTFNIQNGSYVEWTGNIMNPQLNITATERVRASVGEDGKTSRIVDVYKRQR